MSTRVGPAMRISRTFPVSFLVAMLSSTIPSTHIRCPNVIRPLKLDQDLLGSVKYVSSIMMIFSRPPILVWSLRVKNTPLENFLYALQDAAKILADIPDSQQIVPMRSFAKN